MSKAKIIDGRSYPPFCVLYSEEILSPEVLGLSNAGLQIWLVINIACNKKDALAVPDLKDIDNSRAWYVSWKHLVESTGLSRASVGRALKELEVAKLITRHRRGLGKQNVVILNSPKSLIPKTIEVKAKSYSQDYGRQSRIEPGGTHSEETSDPSVVSRGETLNRTPKTNSPTGVHDKPDEEIMNHETQPEAATAWLAILELMTAEIGHEDTHIWLSPAEPISLVTKHLTVEVPNRHYIDFWGENYLTQLNDVMIKVVGKNSVLKISTAGRSSTNPF